LFARLSGPFIVFFGKLFWSDAAAAAAAVVAVVVVVNGVVRGRIVNTCVLGTV